MATYVVIVDDHAKSRDGLRRCLEARGIEFVGEARNSADAIRVAEKVQPEIVQLDLSLPDYEIGATRRVLVENPSRRFVVIKMPGDPTTVSAAIEAGVRDWEPSEIVAKIEAIVRDETYRVLNRRRIDFFD